MFVAASMALDEHYPKRGPCGICGLFGTQKRDGRHRIIDAISSRHRAGDSVVALARDYGRTPEAIRLALAFGKALA